MARYRREAWRLGCLKITLAICIWLVGLRPLAAAPPCVGDCDLAGSVTVDELLKGVGIALGNVAVEQCTRIDADANAAVTVDELLVAVNNALDGCPDFVGQYFGSVQLGGDGSAVMLLTTQSDGEANGEITINESAGLVAFLAGGAAGAPIHASVSGTVDLDTGAYSVTGSYVVDGVTVPIGASGTLPLQPGAQGTFSLQLGDQSFQGSVSTGNGSTPTPTRTRPAATATATATASATPAQSGPTPTPPTGGCANGVFSVSFSNPAATNANLSPLTLGRVNASDLFDASSNAFIWVISGNACSPVLGQPFRGVVLQGIGVASGIQPGTYQLASPVPPFINLTYTETNITTDPSQNFIHSWTNTSGMLVIGDLGGGALSFRVMGATMSPSLVVRGAEGTFTLDVNGTITRVD